MSKIDKLKYKYEIAEEFTVDNEIFRKGRIITEQKYNKIPGKYCHFIELVYEDDTEGDELEYYDNRDNKLKKQKNN